MSQTVVQPTFKPAIDFSVSAESFAEKSVIVHCLLETGSRARLWPTTYLVQEDGTRKALLQAYNISRYPEWKYLRSGSVFTLVFEGLDAHCRQFDLLEDIPETGEFVVSAIQRNREDVYRIEV